MTAEGYFFSAICPQLLALDFPFSPGKNKPIELGNLCAVFLVSPRFFFLMVKFLGDIFKSLPTNFWVVLGGFIGVSTITTPIALVYFLTHSQGFDYVRGDTEIKVLGRNATRNTAQSNQNLRDKLNQLETEVSQLKRANPKQQEQIIKELGQTVKESKKVAETAIENSEDLTKVVEETIAE